MKNLTKFSADWPTDWLTDRPTTCVTDWLTDSLAHSFTYSLTHFTQLLIHSESFRHITDHQKYPLTLTPHCYGTQCYGTTHKWVNEWVSEWNECVSEWISEWNEWVSEWMSKWVKWVSDFSTKGPTLSVLHLGRIQFVYNIIYFAITLNLCWFPLYVFMYIWLFTYSHKQTISRT